MHIVALLCAMMLCVFPTCSFGSRLAAGWYHSLALKDDGSVWAWGWNGRGQLGDGTRTNHLTPVKVTGLSDIISISAGPFHSSALKDDGTVWAWGANYYGQIGDGTTTDRLTPVQVVGLSDVVAIGGSHSHTLVLKRDGSVWAWGPNSSGELGDGTTTDRLTPVQVVGLSDVVAISAGGIHSLALKRDGTVWAWGWNDTGQLGTGTNEASLVPVQTSNLTDVIEITTSGSRGSLALKRDGTVWAWGQIWKGYMQSEIYYLPVQVQGLPTVVDVNGLATAAFLATAVDGTVWFLGYIGLDSMAWGISAPENFFRWSKGMTVDNSLLQSITPWSSSYPAPIDGLSQVTDIGAGADHALFLKADGTIWGWGNNYNGELYDGTTISRTTAVRVKDLAFSASTVPSYFLATDFDDDGKDDPMAVDSSGNWFFWHSSSSYSREGPIALGLTGQAAAGDADGDGRGDMALVDSSGTWYFFLSSRGYASPETQYLEPTASSPQPILADFDGDSKADPASVSTSTGWWSVWLSGRSYELVAGQFLPPTASSLQPVAGDFDGDGKADPVMVDAKGNWYFWLSSYFYQLYGNRSFNFGVTLAELGQAGKPVAGDFDGDRKADPAMLDSSGNWYFMLSTAFYLPDGPWYLVLP